MQRSDWAKVQSIASSEYTLLATVKLHKEMTPPTKRESLCCQGVWLALALSVWGMVVENNPTNEKHGTENIEIYTWEEVRKCPGIHESPITLPLTLTQPNPTQFGSFCCELIYHKAFFQGRGGTRDPHTWPTKIHKGGATIYHAHTSRTT
jgi:hypothetical protein